VGPAFTRPTRARMHSSDAQQSSADCPASSGRPWNAHDGPSQRWQSPGSTARPTALVADNSPYMQLPEHKDPPPRGPRHVVGGISPLPLIAASHALCWWPLRRGAHRHAAAWSVRGCSGWTAESAASTTLGLGSCERGGHESMCAAAESQRHQSSAGHLLSYAPVNRSVSTDATVDGMSSRVISLSTV